MKKEFIGFYDPTDDEIDKAWKEGTFAFDANTLLNLYRYTDVTRKDFLHSLKTLNEKLFIPYQAAYEYLNNRIGVIDALEAAYDDLKVGFDDNFDKNLKNHINKFKKHPSILIDNIIKLHQDFLKKIDVELDKQKKKHPSFKTKDYILEELTVLFDKRVGKEIQKLDLKKIYEEGKERYSELIPPGFKDLEEKKKKGDRNIYGDLIIWKELIEYSKKSKKLLIFVTDDRKEDWWKIENGKTIRPREELIKEFFDNTGIRLLIYNADQFLKFAKEKGLVPDLKDKTIEEVKSVRVSDEYNNLITLNSIEKYINSNTMRDVMLSADLLKKYQIGIDKSNQLDSFLNKNLIIDPMYKQAEWVSRNINKNLYNSDININNKNEDFEK